MSMNLEMLKLAKNFCHGNNQMRISQSSFMFTSTLQQLLNNKPSIFEAARKRLAEVKIILERRKPKKKRRK